MGSNAKVYHKQGGAREVVEKGGYILRSVATVTATGSDQATAAALTGEINIVDGADATKGVILPKAEAGMQITVKSTVAAQVLKVYPASGAAINAIAADGAISMAALTCATFVAASATQWYTTPLLPS